MTSSTPAAPDDLDAVRDIVKALEPFNAGGRERILRWVHEKMGIAAVTTPPMSVQATAASAPSPHGGTTPAGSTQSRTDIRTFVDQKAPKSNLQLTAVVAYYYEFEASPDERKEHITKDDLVDACRKAKRTRPASPAQTLVNAAGAGFLDQLGGGRYRINAVGENLVAMVLPESEGAATRTPKRRGAKKVAKAGSKKPGRAKGKGARGRG